MERVLQLMQLMHTSRATKLSNRGDVVGGGAGPSLDRNANLLPMVLVDVHADPRPPTRDNHTPGQPPPKHVCTCTVVRCNPRARAHAHCSALHPAPCC